MVLPTMLDAIIAGIVMKQRSALPLKLIVGTYLLLLIVVNVQIFGAFQFERISKAIGGGKPEVAYIQLAPDHYHLIQTLDLPTTNSVPSTNFLVGPISIVLRSEKELVFVNTADLNAPDTITNLIATNRIETAMVKTKHYPGANSTYITITNIVPYTITNIVKNSVKVYAKQIRTELIDAIRFSP